MIVTAKEIARDLHPVDREWLWKIPCNAGRATPLAFGRLGLSRVRRKWWLFGDLIVVLTPLGLEVRAELAVHHIANAGNKIPAPQEENFMTSWTNRRSARDGALCRHGLLLSDNCGTCYLEAIADMPADDGPRKRCPHGVPIDIPCTTCDPNAARDMRETIEEELDLTKATDPIEPPRAIRYGRQPDRPIPTNWGAPRVKWKGLRETDWRLELFPDAVGLVRRFWDLDQLATDVENSEATADYYRAEFNHAMGEAKAFLERIDGPPAPLPYRRGLSSWPPASLGLPGVEGKELKTRDPGEVADRAIPLLREVVTIGGDRLSKRNQSLWVDLVQDALTFFDWLEHPDREPGSKEDLEAAITQALELIAGNCEESEILRAALERARAAKG